MLLFYLNFINRVRLHVAVTVIFSCFLYITSSIAQVNTGGTATTANHQKQVIGYLSNWDAWKAANAGLPAQGALNHLNIDYAKYTIINYSFFGVAKDGSLHAGDFRNKNINQPGAVQEPADIFFVDPYSSWDMHLLFGELELAQFISQEVADRATAQGFQVQVNGTTWSHPGWGLMNKPLPIPLHKVGGAPGVLELAHSKGVKVMASIGGWSMCKHFPEMAADPVKRQRFINDCVKLINTGFDGIDLDWEFVGPYAGMNFTGSQADFVNFTNLVQAIRNAIGPSKLITAALSADPVKLQGFEWAKISTTMNYFNIMTYDFNGGWSDKAGHNAPLFNYDNSEAPTFNWDASYSALVALGVPKNKINMGSPFYGRGVVTSSAAALNAPTLKRAETVQPDGAITTCADFTNWPKDVYDGTPLYFYIKQVALAAGSGWTRSFDNQAKVPYLTKGSYFLSYDDEESIGHKAQYINDRQLAGTIVWTVFGDLEISGSPTAFGPKLNRYSSVKSVLVNKLNEVFAQGSSGIPTVSITSPASGATFTAPATVTINVNASDAGGSISKVDFYNGTTLLGTDTSSPYSFSWTNVPGGTYSLTAKATDNSNLSATSSAVSITVNGSPTGAVTTYKDCNYTGAAVALPVGDYTLAQLNSRGILDNDMSSLRVTSGYQITLYDTDNFTGATLVVTADNACLVGAGWNDRTTSVRVSTTANPAPTTSITSPANGATFTAPASITINANAADTAPGTISSVAFYNGSTLLSTDISSPYSFTWTNVASGTYSLTTRATDNQGATGTSAVVNITINASGVVTTYKDCNYTGTAVSLPVGDYTLAQLNSRGILDNDMSSLRVTSGYQITLYDTDNFTGATLVVSADNSCLVAAGWNDRVTSARVSTTANPAPTTSITSPANGATFTAPASITINANAADTAPGTVSSVAFYNGSTLLSTDTSSPYSFTWTSVAAGTYSLATRATDNQGATGTSAVVNITVNSSGVVTTYKDCNYTGTAVSLPVGDYTLAQLNSRGILNNDISSLRITSGYQITLYDTDNFTGATLVVTADDACLVAAGWNDRTTAARVAASTPSFSATIQSENWLSMSGVQTEACSEGGLNVGWIDAGDWMAYNVTIPATGTYSVIYRISSPNPNISLRLEKDNGTTQLGTVPVTNTGGWQNWQSVAHNVTLPAGTYPIGIATATGGFNINYLTITNNLSGRSRTEEGIELELVSEEQSEFMLFPNPVKDQLFIHDYANVKFVTIYNTQGQEMISVERPGNSISVQSLNPGLHIGVIERLDSSIKKQKVVKE